MDNQLNLLSNEPPVAAQAWSNCSPMLASVDIVNKAVLTLKNHAHNVEVVDACCDALRKLVSRVDVCDRFMVPAPLPTIGAKPPALVQPWRLIASIIYRPVVRRGTLLSCLQILASVATSQASRRPHRMGTARLLKQLMTILNDSSLHSYDGVRILATAMELLLTLTLGCSIVRTRYDVLTATCSATLLTAVLNGIPALMHAAAFTMQSASVSPNTADALALAEVNATGTYGRFVFRDRLFRASLQLFQRLSASLDVAPALIQAGIVPWTVAALQSACFSLACVESSLRILHNVCRLAIVPTIGFKQDNDHLFPAMKALTSTGSLQVRIAHRSFACRQNEPGPSHVLSLLTHCTGRGVALCLDPYTN